ncbi:hypothetical protein HG15A2_39610 [Adhaeretor mobilis]|uniref:DUF4189 domain-containing protein n=1 Tax=Adhaeretor mobilis TaxID=1930276 RepID=A0A517N0G0_9BACT|nr:hypothetical protein HG15A2_39610 [Adhaeretor mobilis]
MYGYVLSNPSYWLDPSGREAALAAGGFWAWVWGTGGTTAAGSSAVAAAPVVIAAGAAVAAPIAGYHVGDRWEQTYGWGEAVGNWWSPAPLAPSPSPTPPTIPNTFPRTRPQSIPNPQPEPEPEPYRPYFPDCPEETDGKDRWRCTIKARNWSVGTPCYGEIFSGAGSTEAEAAAIATQACHDAGCHKPGSGGDCGHVTCRKLP